MTVDFDASGCDFGPSFTVETVREGGVNTWFVSLSPRKFSTLPRPILFFRSTFCRVNENPEIIETSGYIFPCWLIVSNSSAVDVPGLDAAKSSAVFKRWLAPGTNGIASVNQRETTVVLPVPVVGRYVRIQRQDSQYLSIAEVEVFSERTWLLCLCLPVFFHILTAVVFVCERFRVCNHVQLPWRITRCFSNFPA
jgi:hypothetical protein